MSSWRCKDSGRVLGRKERFRRDSQKRCIVSLKGFHIDPHKICLFCTRAYYRYVRNLRMKASQHRGSTLDDSCVFTYRMARITGDAPSHCFTPLHSRLGWNSRESSQPLSARRNAQPLGRAFNPVPRRSRVRECSILIANFICS